MGYIDVYWGYNPLILTFYKLVRTSKHKVQIDADHLLSDDELDTDNADGPEMVEAVAGGDGFLSTFWWVHW